MFSQLVVPLDGSQLAEAILPIVANLARQLGAKVTLLHIIERNAPQEIHGERHLTNEAEAYAYLGEIAARFFPNEVPVKQHVHTTEVNDVAQSIVDHTGELGTDLIAMCTHGRSGLHTWLFGSIAQQVLSLGKTPVLLVHPDKTVIMAGYQCQQLVVPLDGNPDHEEGLRVATQMAGICHAALHLVMVVHTYGTLPGEQAATATLLPASTTAMLDLAEEKGERYLQQLKKDIQEQGVTVTSEVRRGDPVKAIVKASSDTHANLIVMGTHGKSSQDSFWSGSITPKITGRAHIPLLLVPIDKQ